MKRVATRSRQLTCKLTVESLEARTLLSVSNELVVDSDRDAFGLDRASLVTHSVDAGDYYVAEGRPIPLQRRDRELVVKLRPDARQALDAGTLWAEYRIARQLDATTAVVVPFATAKTPEQLALDASQDLLWSAPLFFDEASMSRLELAHFNVA